MNEDLADEISALNSIYGDNCITPSGSGSTYVLRPPTSTISPQLTLTLSFPENYPHAAPIILDGAGGGNKGGVAGKKELARDVLRNVWREGDVCLYDLVEGMRELLEAVTEGDDEDERGLGREHSPSVVVEGQQHVPQHPWVVADAIVEKKSVFVARAIEVHSVEEAKRYVADLIAGDKKIAKATHNMTGIYTHFPVSAVCIKRVGEKRIGSGVKRTELCFKTMTTMEKLQQEAGWRIYCRSWMCGMSWLLCRGGTEGLS